MSIMMATRSVSHRAIAFDSVALRQKTLCMYQFSIALHCVRLCGLCNMLLSGYEAVLACAESLQNLGVEKIVIAPPFDSN